VGRKREILEEEVFYGGGKGERDPRRKEKERIDQRKGDLGDQSKGKGNLDQRGHWKKKKKVFGKEGGVFRGSRSSRLLGLVFCLMMMMMWFFIEDWISF
jgi:hypothetical protein